VRDINPQITVNAHRCFFMPDTADQFDFSAYDYVVDCIDTVTAKLDLVMQCRAVGTPIVCALGTGNKLDPTRLELSDISKTSVCPLARVMRKELRRRGVEHLKVVYSREKPLRPLEKIQTPEEKGRRDIPGSTAFVPGAAGLILAGEVVKDLIAFDRSGREEE
jgi:tRNA A37 threonylcarbamoyladenosine dehydratase